MQSNSGDIGYRKYYKMHGKPMDSKGVSSHRGIDDFGKPTGYTNPSKARQRVKLPDGRSAFEH